MKLKDFWNKNKLLCIFIILVFILIILLLIFIFYKNKNDTKTEERINISEFSNTLEIKKEGRILSYPEIIVLSESDGEIVSLNVEQGDIVEEWDILMQIGNEELGEETIDKVEKHIGGKYREFYDNMDEYNEFEIQYGGEISLLEQELIENNAALKIATDTNDIKTLEATKNNIQDINQKLTALKLQRDSYKSRISNIENEIQSANKESIDLYYEFDKQTPRAPIQGIIGDIYVQEGDEIKNGDKLCTIINNNYVPEISVGLDFNEYVFTQDLTGVMIITENENRGNSYYVGEIFTRSPIINDEGKYTITVKIMEDDVPNLILSDENTKITVIFTKDFETIWIPENCFTSLLNTGGVLTLSENDIIIEKEVGIKNRWENWVNIDDMGLYSIEKNNKILCRLNEN